MFRRAAANFNPLAAMAGRVTVAEVEGLLEPLAHADVSRPYAGQEPREETDTDVLAAVRDASATGIAFPLSSTRYIGTNKITGPRQRADLARTMASVSHCRTLRSRRVLLRHQMLRSMNVSFGRLAFRPWPPQALGIGATWAFAGERAALSLYGPPGKVDAGSIPGMRPWLRKANEFAEFQLLAEPRDEEMEEQRRRGRYALGFPSGRRTTSHVVPIPHRPGPRGLSPIRDAGIYEMLIS